MRHLGMRERKVILRIDAPCPCGSGNAIADCHLDVDGRFRKHLPPLRPPGSPTGFSHPNCYLRETYDCSEQISREHYISRSVLEQLGSVLRVSGMPWLATSLRMLLALSIIPGRDGSLPAKTTITLPSFKSRCPKFNSPSHNNGSNIEILLGLLSNSSRKSNGTLSSTFIFRAASSAGIKSSLVCNAVILNVIAVILWWRSA